MGSFAVVGATSWGVTLAWLLATNGNEVTIITRTREEADAVAKRRGLERLPGAVLPASVSILHAHAAAGAPDGIVFAVPARALRENIASLHLDRVPALSAAKGIEPGTGLRMTEVLIDCHWRPEDVAALSGPNLSHEVVRGMPAAAVVASASPERAGEWQQALAGHSFRTYTSGDVIGVELAGALKNVVAIAAGAGWGLDFGANAVAAIMTRGLAEMTRLGVALGARAATFQGLAGVGDLAATCFSPLSRNRRLGELLARGRTPQAAISEIGEAVEGAWTAPVVLELAKQTDVELPIAARVSDVMEGRCSVAEAMSQLLNRPLKPESYGI